MKNFKLPPIYSSFLKLYFSGVLTLVIDRLMHGPALTDWASIQSILLAAAPPVLVVIKNYFDPKFPMYGKPPKDEVIIDKETGKQVN